MNKKPVIILGNGGHARVLTEILMLNDVEIMGYTSPSIENNKFDLKYLGNDEAILNYDIKKIELVNGLGSVSNTSMRFKIYSDLSDKGYKFGSVIHPSAIISRTAELGEGVQVMAGVVIQPFVQIDDNTIINTVVSIDHDCKIGKHCHIAPGSILSGLAHIKDNTHIGTGTTIIQDVTIGANVLVGAGSLVLKSVSNNKVIYGRPAKEV